MAIKKTIRTRQPFPNSLVAARRGSRNGEAMAEEEKQEAEIQQELGSRSPKPEARSPKTVTVYIEDRQEQEPEARSPKTVTVYIEDRQEQEADAAPPEDETDRLAKGGPRPSSRTEEGFTSRAPGGMS